ncbi:polysaccharide lyase [Pontibacter mangrovi]|uniref:polysaccharide lyase n=1 Tax=Pontibacter mangrovi TaxID=2589816 RepID=UPI0015E35AFB|nr:polysaccharide lyase [Pontibacter mangrovi]
MEPLLAKASAHFAPMQAGYNQQEVPDEITFEEEPPFSDEQLQVATPYAFRLETDTVFSGDKSGRFELRYGDPQVQHGTRAELIVHGRPSGDERWYRFALYAPATGYAPDTASDVISQWWQTSRSTQATSLRVLNDRLILRTGAHPDSLEEVDIGRLQKNTWQVFVFHFIHSAGPEGLLEVWCNGKKLLQRRGGNMYAMRLPYWKVGIYKASWNNGKTAAAKRVLFFDNILISDTAIYTAKADQDHKVPSLK